jgi:hypothetical protein
MELLSELLAWLRALDPAFAFLLALPFAVAAVGLAVELRRRPARRARRAPRSSAASGMPDRAAHAP